MANKTMLEQDGLMTRHVAVDALSARLQGDLVLPGDAAYETARAVFNAAVDGRPALIVFCADAADVIAAVNFARAQELSVAVRGGGHSLAGYGTCDGGGVLIDLSRMKGIEIDPVRRTARLEPGLTWAEVASATHAHRLALTSGDQGAVGVGGLILGGGIGWMARKYGLTIDRLRAVELVTANGRLVRASATDNAYLFWGLRGGGGNFGVAVAFEVDLHPGGIVLGGMICYDAAAAAQILQAYVRYALAAPDELTAELFIMPAPPAPFIPQAWHGRTVVTILPCYVGDLAEGERVIAPLRQLGAPIAEAIAPIPYPALFAQTAEAAAHGRRHDVRNLFLKAPSEDALATLVEEAMAIVSAEAVVGLCVLGGAVGRVPADATAFAHRDTPVWVEAIAAGPDAEGDARRQARVDRFWRAMRPYAACAYVNMMSRNEADQTGDAYPLATYALLAALKRRYDPTNLFRHNHNIVPAS
jgi:FAD/FMN-containing dehydrogenase